MSSPKPVAHGHLDQGSFVLYKNSVPLVMDSGIEGYFESSTPWHICSYSHACLQFATRRKAISQDFNGAINRQPAPIAWSVAGQTCRKQVGYLTYNWGERLRASQSHPE
ncbi:heparinase II/III family protein [Paenibacillus thiaminolyticus]|uniref:heparinase II/III domain-containing protein n=1 Tax=Paenibacillus thiaminolyticus TaxID=49283 RepID=UPI0035A73E08